MAGLASDPAPIDGPRSLASRVGAFILIPPRPSTGNQRISQSSASQRV